MNNASTMDPRHSDNSNASSGKIVRQQSFGRRTTALCTVTTADMPWYSSQGSAVLVLVAQLSITWSLKDNRTLNRVISGKGCGPGDFAATHTLMLWFSSSVPELLEAILNYIFHHHTQSRAHKSSLKSHMFHHTKGLNNVFD